MLDQIKKEIMCEAFRAMVGRTIQCACGSILDVSNAVEITLLQDDNSIAYSRVFCGSCADTNVNHFEKVRNEFDLAADIFDGRAINWKRGRTIKANKNPYQLKGVIGSF